jgi:hypothetical protein
VTAEMIVKVTKTSAVEPIEAALWKTCDRVGVFIHGVLAVLLLKHVQWHRSHD